jgi:uncharacterized protein YjbI with pentapeptide repeats
MAELNPHRKTARIFAFACYILAALMLIAGIFFTLIGAMMDISQLKLEGVTNQRMAVMLASGFLIITLMIGLLGWWTQRLFGQRWRQDKLGAKSAVGCLRLGSLGCGLWALPSTVCVLITGTMLSDSKPAGLADIFIGTSGFVFAIVLMLAIAWFISANYARLNSEERRRAYSAYQNTIQPYLTQLAEPQARIFVQEQTIEILEKLDTSLKSALLVFLSQSGLLSGDTRLALQGADFRRVDLSSINLPGADLREIDLERAVLRSASLFRANLQRARLKHADLSSANLQEADLREADFTGAVLEGANLTDANLTGAKLTAEQLHHAFDRNALT